MNSRKTRAYPFFRSQPLSQKRDKRLKRAIKAAMARGRFKGSRTAERWAFKQKKARKL